MTVRAPKLASERSSSPRGGCPFSEDLGVRARRVDLWNAPEIRFTDFDEIAASMMGTREGGHNLHLMLTEAKERNAMKLSICMVLTVTVWVSIAANAYGTEGHALVADMAESNLRPDAKLEVLRLLAQEGSKHLSDVSSWADDFRSTHPETGPAHCDDQRLPISFARRRAMLFLCRPLYSRFPRCRPARLERR